MIEPPNRNRDAFYAVAILLSLLTFVLLVGSVIAADYSVGTSLFLIAIVTAFVAVSLYVLGRGAR